MGRPGRCEISVLSSEYEVSPPPGLCFEPDDSIILEGSGIFQKWGVVGGSGHWQSGFLRGIPVAKLLPVQEMGHLLPNTWYHGQNP